MSDDIQQLKRIIEGAIMAAGEPVSIRRIQALFSEQDMPENDTILEAIEQIQQDCEARGFELKEVSSGWRFQVKKDLATWVNKLWEEKPQKYSRALLETLALIAYRQPLTRGDIEDVRGVAVSSHIIKTLVEREWVKAVGHRDVPGRPALYATTRQFLDYFNMKSLDELPTLNELKDIDGLNQSLEFDEISQATQEGEETSSSEPQVPPDHAPESLEGGAQSTAQEGDEYQSGPMLEEDGEPPLEQEDHLRDRVSAAPSEEEPSDHPDNERSTVEEEGTREVADQQYDDDDEERTRTPQTQEQELND